MTNFPEVDSDHARPAFQKRKHHARTRALGAALLTLAFVACLLVLARRVDGQKVDGAAEKATPATPPTATATATTTTDYSELVAKSYDYRFGSNPFAPSNATSATGKFIPGDKFVLAERCSRCHTDAHAQWLQSAHRNSFREPFYQKNVGDIIAQKDIAHTRHCESCHNPAALFSGMLTKNPVSKKRPFDDDGVSCIACHSMQAAKGLGIGGYVMDEPALLVKEDGTRLLETVTDQQILDDIPSHKRAMMRPLLKSPEFCATCHKSQVPKELNDYKFLRAFSVGDELQMSSFSKESPHPFYVRNKETCNSCHMTREAAPLFDAAAKEGKLATHRWAAANTAIPYFFGWKEQLEAVTKFLEDDKMGVDIFAISRRSSDGARQEFVAPANRHDFRLEAGDEITADVVITNKNIGHSFPPELRDFYEAHIEFTVTDEAGRTLYQSGFIKPDGYLDDSAHNYKTYLVMPDGTFNDKHHIWRTRIVAQNNQIHSGRSDVARYRFQIPATASASGAFNLRARLRYRRFTRTFSDYVLKPLAKPLDYPVVTMATAEFVMRVGENKAQAAAGAPKGAMPDWRRWNNYGIALLDQRQFALAADTFARVGELDEAYRPMAKVNRALALIELDRWNDAAQLIDEAIQLDPKNMRAVFQRARIRTRRGQLDTAEADIRQVLAVYPRDRLSLQQLGELSKIKRDYAAARNAYEQILQIDPEDAGAHYNLMLVYRKLGMKEEAKQEAKLFADLKDDPSALHIASDFLRRHPEMKGESAPWHVHNLAAKHAETAGGGER